MFHDQITAEMTIGVVIFLSACVAVLLSWLLRSHWYTNILQWISLMICSQRRIVFISIQEDENLRAAIGKQTYCHLLLAAPLKYMVFPLDHRSRRGNGVWSVSKLLQFQCPERQICKYIDLRSRTPNMHVPF